MLPEPSTTEFSPELVTVSPEDASQPPNILGTGAKPLESGVAMQNVPEQGNKESMAEGPVATNAAAVPQDHDNGDGPSEKSSEEAAAVETASQRSDHRDKAAVLAHQEDSTNEHHIVDMMHAEGSKQDEHAVGIEPASGAPPASGDGAKPEENAAHAEQGDQRPAGGGGATTASPPNNINGAIMTCACAVVIVIRYGRGLQHRGIYYSNTARAQSSHGYTTGCADV
ncbi:hypothetical protein HPB51_006520 [Rhipicephalus microplus]|uniref:Uncharacterized protein n=1 Tax=Rhipicephalus microplus TaxID=6941 RepID=A0A9J6E7J3_RHIMP|nr:hypothetical protein HPB51_006520 [Rhipicephalus microplus]